MSQAALSRRAVLAGGGGLVIGVFLPFRAKGAAAAAPPVAVPDPAAFIRIAPDSEVTIVIKHIEMGQGSYTGLATVVAEELDADWAQVRAEAAPANARLYANTLMAGMQGTGGSNAMAESFVQMRQAGAAARAMLVAAAAGRWDVTPAEITVERGVLRHAASGRSGRFGDFADAASRLSPPSQVKLKAPEDFTLIGKDRPGIRLDSAAKAGGTAAFGIDQQAADMLTVLVARPPRFGAKLARFDATATLALPGVVAVRAITAGVAVYARTMWAAIRGRAALRIEWDESAAESRGSEEMIAQYRALARQPGTLVRTVGDVDAVLAGGQAIEADYVFPYLAHAPMEPLNGLLEWDGKRATARFGSQIPTIDQAAIAKTLGLQTDGVTLITTLTGGSFGRRAQSNAHFAIELAEAAKAIGPGRPVKLVWTREDDIQGGYYRPLMVHRMRGLVRDGRITAWSDDVVGQSFVYGSPFEPFGTAKGYDGVMVEGAEDLPYHIPAFRLTVRHDPTPVPSLWWRSVGHSHTGYAVETFVDRLLEAAGRDPVAGRLALMDGAPRAAGVLRAVAAAARWEGRTRPGGIGRGVAVVESFGTYVAQIADVTRGADGLPRVEKVWAAVDCGVAVNPDVIRAQIEGAIGFATGHALFGEVPLVAGRPQRSNFGDYRALRIQEMPAVEVTIVRSAEPPSGIGEPGVPPCAPAIANALAALGEERPTRLPMVRAA